MEGAHPKDHVSDMIQLVSFRLAQEEYGVNVLIVREIIRMLNITRVPSTPHYVEGVINLRGKVVPIISLRKRFNLPEGSYDQHTRIMVLEMLGEMMGFIVDEVSEVLRISVNEIQPPPTIVSTAIDQECMTGLINQPNRLLILLDLAKMFSSEEIRSIGSTA